MIDKAIGVIVSIIGLAALSVVISKKSNTANVADSLLGNLRKLIATAVSPVTGG